MIKYVTGDSTRPIGAGPKVIAHVCNDVGGWGRGFVVAVSKRWAAPEMVYRKWAADPKYAPFELGQVQFVTVDDRVWIANMIGQHDTRIINRVPPVRYEAIETALAKVAEFAIEQSASVHMPRIGCGLAGGSWETVERIVDRSLCPRSIDVTVYDLPLV